MDKKEKIELVRKRNIELTQQLEKLKQKIQSDEYLKSKNYNDAKDLINDLENIKLNWLDCISEIKQYEDEYIKIITELREIKLIMNNMGFKIPWYRRIILKLKTNKS